jgi:hypothetical protein
MAERLGELTLTGIKSAELDREWRVLTQALSMHCMLRDKFARRALILDLVLLGASVVFAVTTFASAEVLDEIGVNHINGRLVLGIASVAAFFGSLVDLRVDWKGKSAIHREAVKDLTDLVGRFRAARRPEDTWDHSQLDNLLGRYWEVANAIAPIPDADFLPLKSRHLRKIALSKMLDEAPGAPIWLLRVRIVLSSIRKALARRPPSAS